MVVRNNPVVFAAIRDELRSELDTTCDIVLDADDHTAAVTARSHLPGLIAGLCALLAQHTPVPKQSA